MAPQLSVILGAYELSTTIQVARSSQPIRGLHSASKQEVNDLSWIKLASYFGLLFVACSPQTLPANLSCSPQQGEDGNEGISDPITCSTTTDNTGVRKPGYITSDKALLYTRLQLVMANLPPYLSCMQQERRQSLCHRILLLLLAIHCWGEKKYINSHLEPHTQTTCDLGSLGFIPSIVPISHSRSGNETRGGWFQPHSQVIPTVQFFTVSDQNLDGGEGLGMRLEQRRTAERGSVSLCSV